MYLHSVAFWVNPTIYRFVAQFLFFENEIHPSPSKNPARYAQEKIIQLISD